MIRREYYQAPKYLTDLKEAHTSDTSIALAGNAKNLERLKDLHVSKLWLIGPNDKELRNILALVKPEFLNIYQVLCKDLSILETLVNTETIILRWNSKSETLWDMAHNKKLKTLVIEDFQKITNINPIANALTLDYLILEGGMWKPLKLDTLMPLSNLTNLQFLRLANMQLKLDGLTPVAHLQHLKELMLSNQFETIDYAFLTAKLKKTQCSEFTPYVKLSRSIGDKDVMVRGKRKPFLNFEKDQLKIEKYTQEFDEMVKKFSQH